MPYFLTGRTAFQAIHPLESRIKRMLPNPKMTRLNLLQESIPMAEKILVAVEGSEPSLKESSMKAAGYSIKLASILGAELLAICVVQNPEYIEENTRAMMHEELFEKSIETLGEIKELASDSTVNFGEEILKLMVRLRRLSATMRRNME